MVWFRTFHPEKLPSAIERYDKESLRIIGVIDAHLTKQGTPYLVGDKVTYADLMFVCWTYIFDERYPEDFDLSEFKSYNAWINRIKERPAVKKVWADWAEAKKATK
jgi:glutathione S-transferase